ncbi:MAG: hypothetical protein Q7S74_04405 [Nanoarchaeota archaeon]|nr:hypothetical protein [Nanoarchaeota archaeon]
MEDSAVLELEKPETQLNESQTQVLLIPPKSQIRPSSQQTIAGNKYDLVLACHPDARDNYELYDKIVNLVEEKKGLRIYSPHTDIKNGNDLEDTINFTVTEAIPRTKAVIVSLTTITPQIQEMFDATYLNNRPFLLFYASGTTPFNERNAIAIRSHPTFRGEFIYRSDEHALSLLESRMTRLIGTG